MQPLKMAKKVYNHIGKRLPTEIADWIRESQRASTTEAPKTVVKEKLRKRKYDPYSTNRNSTYTMMKWRFENSFEDLQSVQRVCKNMMELGGYLPILHESDMQNLTIKVLDKNPFENG